MSTATKPLVGIPPGAAIVVVALLVSPIGVVAPLAYFPFGGSRGSFYGDLKAQGRDAIAFYTDQRVVVSRWPRTTNGA